MDKKRIAYHTEWDKKNTIQFKMKLVRTTDADVIEKLQSVPNRQGYLKALIREDIKREKGE